MNFKTTPMNQKGMIPIHLLIGILIIGSIGGFIYFKKTSNTNQLANSSATPASPAPTEQQTTTQKKSSPTLTATPKQLPRLSPTPTTPTQNQAVIKKNTCDVSVVYGRLDGGASDPLLVTLLYSFTGYNNVYMTGAQWDFEGDGNWDTDMKQSNGTIEHTYGSGGIYNVKSRLQASDGSTTDVCSKTVSLAAAINISLKGQVYKDLNCNNTKDSEEAAAAGASITIMTPGGSVYETVTSDTNGNYSFTKKISVNDSLTIIPMPNDHNLVFTPPSVTLNAQNHSATINISQVPVEYTQYCNR